MLETQPQTPLAVPPAETEVAPLVTLSDAAVAKLTELTKDESDPNVGPARLRLQRWLQRLSATA